MRFEPDGGRDRDLRTVLYAELPHDPPNMHFNRSFGHTKVECDQLVRSHPGEAAL